MCIGFLGIIIYYKYIEKQRLNKKETEEKAILESLAKEEAQRKELEKLSIFNKDIKLNSNNIRNAIINNNSNEKREKEEFELRKKMNS